jgi:hypothetical protein
VCSLIDFPWLLQARPVNALRKNLQALPIKNLKKKETKRRETARVENVVVA